jgi:hypothetical protein
VVKNQRLAAQNETLAAQAKLSSIHDNFSVSVANLKETFTEVLSHRDKEVEWRDAEIEKLQVKLSRGAHDDLDDLPATSSSPSSSWEVSKAADLTAAPTQEKAGADSRGTGVGATKGTSSSSSTTTMDNLFEEVSKSKASLCHHMWVQFALHTKLAGVEAQRQTAVDNLSVAREEVQKWSAKSAALMARSERLQMDGEDIRPDAAGLAASMQEQELRYDRHVEQELRREVESCKGVERELRENVEVLAAELNVQKENMAALEDLNAALHLDKERAEARMTEAVEAAVRHQQKMQLRRSAAECSRHMSELDMAKRDFEGSLKHAQRTGLVRTIIRALRLKASTFAATEVARSFALWKQLCVSSAQGTQQKQLLHLEQANREKAAAFNDTTQHGLLQFGLERLLLRHSLKSVSADQRDLASSFSFWKQQLWSCKLAHERVLRSDLQQDMGSLITQHRSAVLKGGLVCILGVCARLAPHSPQHLGLLLRYNFVRWRTQTLESVSKSQMLGHQMVWANERVLCNKAHLRLAWNHWTSQAQCVVLERKHQHAEDNLHRLQQLQKVQDAESLERQSCERAVALRRCVAWRGFRREQCQRRACFSKWAAGVQACKFEIFAETLHARTAEAQAAGQQSVSGCKLLLALFRATASRAPLAMVAARWAQWRRFAQYVVFQEAMSEGASAVKLASLQTMSQLVTSRCLKGVARHFALWRLQILAGKDAQRCRELNKTHTQAMSDTVSTMTLQFETGRDKGAACYTLDQIWRSQHAVAKGTAFSRWDRNVKELRMVLTLRVLASLLDFTTVQKTLLQQSFNKMKCHCFAAQQNQMSHFYETAMGATNTKIAELRRQASVQVVGAMFRCGNARTVARCFSLWRCQTAVVTEMKSGLQRSERHHEETMLNSVNAMTVEFESQQRKERGCFSMERILLSQSIVGRRAIFFSRWKGAAKTVGTARQLSAVAAAKQKEAAVRTIGRVLVSSCTRSVARYFAGWRYHVVFGTSLQHAVSKHRSALDSSIQGRVKFLNTQFERKYKQDAACLALDRIVASQSAAGKTRRVLFVQWRIIARHETMTVKWKVVARLVAYVGEVRKVHLSRTFAAWKVRVQQADVVRVLNAKSFHQMESQKTIMAFTIGVQLRREVGLWLLKRCLRRFDARNGTVGVLAGGFQRWRWACKGTTHVARVCHAAFAALSEHWRHELMLALSRWQKITFVDSLKQRSRHVCVVCCRLKVRAMLAVNHAFSTWKWQHRVEAATNVLNAECLQKIESDKHALYITISVQLRKEVSMWLIKRCVRRLDLRTNSLELCRRFFACWIAFSKDVELGQKARTGILGKACSLLANACSREQARSTAVAFSKWIHVDTSTIAQQKWQERHQQALLTAQQQHNCELARQSASLRHNFGARKVVECVVRLVHSRKFAAFCTWKSWASAGPSYLFWRNQNLIYLLFILRNHTAAIDRKLLRTSFTQWKQTNQRASQLEKAARRRNHHLQSCASLGERHQLRACFSQWRRFDTREQRLRRFRRHLNQHSTLLERSSLRAFFSHWKELDSRERRVHRCRQHFGNVAVLLNRRLCRVFFCRWVQHDRRVQGLGRFRRHLRNYVVEAERAELRGSFHRWTRASQRGRILERSLLVLQCAVRHQKHTGFWKWKEYVMVSITNARWKRHLAASCDFMKLLRDVGDRMATARSFGLWRRAVTFRPLLEYERERDRRSSRDLNHRPRAAAREECSSGSERENPTSNRSRDTRAARGFGDEHGSGVRQSGFIEEGNVAQASAPAWKEGRSAVQSLALDEERGARSYAQPVPLKLQDSGGGRPVQIHPQLQQKPAPSRGADTASLQQLRQRQLLPFDVEVIFDEILLAIVDGDKDQVRKALASVLRSRTLQQARHGHDHGQEHDCDGGATVTKLGSLNLIHRAISGFHFHGSQDKMVSVIHELIQCGADVDGQDSTGQTPIHKAIQLCTVNSALAVIDVLVLAGAAVDIPDQNGDTAVHLEMGKMQNKSRGAIVRAMAKARTFARAAALQNKDAITPLGLLFKHAVDDMESAAALPPSPSSRGKRRGRGGSSHFDAASFAEVLHFVLVENRHRGGRSGVGGSGGKGSTAAATAPAQDLAMLNMAHLATLVLYGSTRNSVLHILFHYCEVYI